MAKEPLIIKSAGDLVISANQISEGRDIVIVAESVAFNDGVFISSGYSASARAGTLDQAGADGSKAGSITIIAKEVRSLRLKTVGQAGGRGGDGRNATGQGEPGKDQPPGRDAKCQMVNSWHGGDGLPGGTGGKGPTGGPGRRGGKSGAGGSVTIKCVSSRVSFTSVPKNVIDLSHGQPGAGGAGGNGGPGGRAGKGGAGGKGDIDCVDKHGESKPLRPGKQGPDGQPGDPGDRGSSEGEGATNTDGSFQLVRYQNEAEFYEEAVAYVPALVTGLLPKAELLYLLRRIDEAKPLLEQIAAVGGNHPNVERAHTLLANIEDGFNYFGAAQRSAVVLFKTGPTGVRNVPLTREDVRSEFERLERDVRVAEEILNYRRRQAFDATRAAEAYQLERDRLASRTKELTTDIDSFKREIEQLRERLTSFEQQSKDLKARIERLAATLTNLGDEGRKALANLVSSVDQTVGHITMIGAALGASNWMGAAQGMISFFNQADAAANAAQAAIKWVNELKSQLEKAKDDLFFVKNEMSNIEMSIVKLRLRRVSAQQQIGDYEVMSTNLNNWWNSTDAARLSALAEIAEKAHRDTRMSVAKRALTLMRYADLRTLRNDGLKPQFPRDGIYQAYSATHLRDILDRVNEQMLDDPPTASDEYSVELTAENDVEFFKSFNAGQRTPNVVSRVSGNYATGRLVWFGVDLDAEASGPTEATDVDVEYHSTQYFASEDMEPAYILPQYKVPISSGGFSDNARIFAYQSPLTTWTLTRRPGAKPAKKLTLRFLLEVPVDMAGSDVHVTGPATIDPQTTQQAALQLNRRWERVAALERANAPA